MVHISDGILSTPVLAAGWAVTLIVMAAVLWRREQKGSAAEDIPKLSVITAAFFVGSLIHVPVGPTSVHLVLNGLVGVVLGLLAFPAIFIGLILQTVLFQHGGVTTIGINAAIMGIPALMAYGVFRGGIERGGQKLGPLFGTIAGGFAVGLAVLFLVLSLLTTGEEFTSVAGVIGVAHLPVIAIEAAVTGSVVGFLQKVKPELIQGGG
ncbi:MAG: cobalt transporter CbiM [Archaeoglobaceae archaeon]